jgi:hypothetical protein
MLQATIVLVVGVLLLFLSLACKENRHVLRVIGLHGCRRGY